MRYRFYPLVFLIGILSCENSPKEEDFNHSLPEGAALLFSTQNAVNTHDYLKDLNLFGWSAWQNAIPKNLLDSLGMESIAIGFYHTKQNEAFVISGRLPSPNDSMPNGTMQLTKEAQKISRRADGLFQKISESNQLISNDSLLLSGKQKEQQPLLKKLHKVERTHQGHSIITKTALADIPLSFIKNSADSLGASGRLFLDVNPNRRQLSYSGIFQPDTSATAFYSKAHSSKLLQLISADADSWQIRTIDNRLYNRESKASNDTQTDSLPDFNKLSLEGSYFQLNNQDLMAFHLGNPDFLKQDLQLVAIEETYRDMPIYKYSWRYKPLSAAGSLKGDFTSSYLVLVEDFVILSVSLEALKSCLVDFLNGNTVINSDSFKRLSADLRTSFSYMAFGNAKTLSKLFPKSKLGYNRSYFQLSLEDEFLHVNGLLADYQRLKNAAPVEEIHSVSIDQAILKSPQLVKNHLNRGMDILLQDVENNLYLISNQGRILWKKRLNGPILGDVAQLDIYKNGRLQLAFCTPSKLYVLDRNGKSVGGFPKNFKDPITQPLSVFDYDRNKNYRLLVTQGKELLMLSAKGKRVSGFKYAPGKTISSQPKHFRIGRRDFIAFKTQNEFTFLNRRGQPRIKVGQQLSFSDNELYLYQSQFTTTDSEGTLIQVDRKGTLRKQPLQLPEDHWIDATSKTLVSQTENKLQIKLKTVDLDYGIYTPPQIFYLNDKIYISTTDKQAKKVFLFDSQAKPIKGFPVFGSSQAVMGNLDNSRTLEMVVQTDAKSLSILRLQ